MRATVFVMEYLSTLDAGFLEVGDSNPHLSYAGDLVFGIIADYDAGRDAEELAGGITPAAFHRPDTRRRWLMIAPPQAGSFYLKGGSDGATADARNP